MFVIKFRRNTPSQWVILNPILELGEPGYEIGTGKFKIGNGRSRWDALDYYLPIADQAQVDLASHIDSETPHPVYDSGPSLMLLYENAKV